LEGPGQDYFFCLQQLRGCSPQNTSKVMMRAPQVGNEESPRESGLALYFYVFLLAT